MGIFSAYIEHPKERIFESQEKDEVIHFLLRRHPITNLGWIVFAIILIITPPLTFQHIQDTLAFIFDNIGNEIETLFYILWYTLTLFFIFESFLSWYFNVYILTDKRVIDVDFSGLWYKRVSEAALDKVEDASYSTDKFWHILFDYGDIQMQTAAEKTEFEFHSIPKPGIVHDKLTDLVQLYKQKHGGNG